MFLKRRPFKPGPFFVLDFDGFHDFSGEIPVPLDPAVVAQCLLYAVHAPAGAAFQRAINRQRPSPIPRRYQHDGTNETTDQYWHKDAGGIEGGHRPPDSNQRSVTSQIGPSPDTVRLVGGKVRGLPGEVP